MKKIARPALDSSSKKYLAKLGQRVRTSRAPSSEADRLWNAKTPASFQTIRTVLESMASGRARCMYCEDSFGTDIEHFYPKKRYPHRAFSWDNYLLACSHCNSNLKRERFPFIKRKPALLNPTADDPAEHLAFLPTSGEFVATGVKGQPSIDVFGLNDTEASRKLPQARSETLLKLQVLLEKYDTFIDTQDDKRAALTKRAIQNEPFSAVLGWLLRVSRVRGAAQTLLPGIPALLRKHGVASW